MTASVSNQVDSQTLDTNLKPTNSSGDAQTASLLLNVKEALTATAQQEPSIDQLNKEEQQVDTLLDKLEDPKTPDSEKSSLQKQAQQLLESLEKGIQQKVKDPNIPQSEKITLVTTLQTFVTSSESDLQMYEKAQKENELAKKVKEVEKELKNPNLTYDERNKLIAELNELTSQSAN